MLLPRHSRRLGQASNDRFSQKRTFKILDIHENEGPLSAAISTGRCNTLTKTQKMACMLMNPRRRRGLYGGRESGAVGPLEASRGTEVDWASVWRTLIVCLSPVDAARGDRNPSRED